MLGEDLLRYDLADIAGGFDDIARWPRRDGETAFPELARLKQAVAERKAVREASEARRQEAELERYRAEHPEEFMSWREFWLHPETQAVARKLAIAPGEVADEGLRKSTIEAEKTTR